MIPAIGSQITFESDIEIEDEDGYIFRVDAGKTLTVVEYDLEVGTTPEQSIATYGTLSIGVELGDIEVYSQTDRSGQSDYTINGGTTYIELEFDPENFKIVK